MGQKVSPIALRIGYIENWRSLWFAEKDEQQQTHLYSLTDMKIRKDLRIQKSYLQGRFGAIPFVGNVEQLQRFIEVSEGVESAKKASNR